MSARDTGKTFLSELLAYVPEEKRADVQAALETNEQALEFAGAATLRQADYSRNLDANNAYKRTLDEWWEENKARLAEYERLQAAGGGTPAPTPSPSPIQTPAPGLTKEAVEEMLVERERAAIAAIVHTNELASKHLKTFNETLDIQALMKDPEIGKIGLLGVYDKTYKPRYDALAKQADDARVNALVQEKLAEERKRFQSLPYPVSGSEPSTLDALLHPPDPAKSGAQAGVDLLNEAVAEYTAAQMARNGATA